MQSQCLGRLFITAPTFQRHSMRVHSWPRHRAFVHFFFYYSGFQTDIQSSSTYAVQMLGKLSTVTAFFNCSKLIIELKSCSCNAPWHKPYFSILKNKTNIFHKDSVVYKGCFVVYAKSKTQSHKITQVFIGFQIIFGHNVFVILQLENNEKDARVKENN